MSVLTIVLVLVAAPDGLTHVELPPSKLTSLTPIEVSVRSDAPWKLHDEVKVERKQSTSAFSRAFHLTEFDRVKPIAPWQDNSCGPFAVACILEAGGAQLSAGECQQLQEELDPNQTGTTPAVIAECLTRYQWTSENVEPATTSMVVEHLHSGYPVLVTLNLPETLHWVLITGYVASEDGHIDTWLLVDNGTSGGRMSNDEFQEKWLGTLFMRHALFVGSRIQSASTAKDVSLSTAPHVSFDTTPYQLTMRDRVQVLMRNPVTAFPTVIALALAMIFGGVYLLLGIIWVVEHTYDVVRFNWL